MKKILFTAFAILLLACTKQSGPGGLKEEICITAMPDEGRSSLSGKDVVWNTGDAISVFDGSRNNRFSTSESGKSVSFTGSALVVDKYTILYPYNEGATLNGDGIHTSLPSAQTAAANSFDPAANISSAIADNNGGTIKATMRNAGCYLKFSIKDSDSGVTKVEVSTLAGEKISGPVAVSTNADGIPSMSAMEGASDKICLSPSGSRFEGATYYIVMRPTSLKQGLSINVTKRGKTIEYTFGNIKETTRNTVYCINGNVDDSIFSISNEDILDEEFFVSARNEDILDDTTPWSEWTDAASVRSSLKKAADAGKVYYSQFKFYNYEKTGELTPYKNLGHPLIYSLDFYKGSGEYYPEESRKEIRANTISIVKKAWKEHRAICSFSWHLESPYAVYNDFYLRQGTSMGCRYLDQSKVGAGESVWVDNFPAEHRFQIREILENKQVHYVNEYVNPQTGQKERFERTFKLGDWFNERCQDVADMINEMVDENGKPIPILIRLWHELEDRWAWWQLYNYSTTKSNCTVADYKAFWALTVKNLRKMCPKGQMLFVFCHDRNFSTEDKYLTAYPGDEYVDIMGYDDYYIGRPEKYDNNPDTAREAMLGRSRVVSAAAKKHGKLAMLCETNIDSSDASLHRVFFDDFVQVMLQDPQTHLSIFQIWSSPGNSADKLDAISRFIQDKNIIFDK